MLPLAGLLVALPLLGEAAPTYKEERESLESRLNEAEALQLRLEELGPQAEEEGRQWRERFEANRLALRQHQRRAQPLQEACRRHRQRLWQLNARGLAAWQAGQPPGAWVLAARRLHAVLQPCEDKARQLHEEGTRLAAEERRLLRLEDALEQRQGRKEALAQALRLHALALTDKLTALPDAHGQGMAWPPPADMADMADMKGRLFPPVFGRLERGYGVFVNPKSNTTTWHKGVRLRTARGSRVRAPAPGRAVHTGSLRGLGKLVVIAHAGGFHSLVAHLEEIFVTEGEEVAQGTWLGTAGEELYFEIRQQGEAQNPQEWFVSLGFR